MDMICLCSVSIIQIKYVSFKCYQVRCHSSWYLFRYCGVFMIQGANCHAFMVRTVAYRYSIQLFCSHMGLSIENTRIMSSSEPSLIPCILNAVLPSLLPSILALACHTTVSLTTRVLLIAAASQMYAYPFQALSPMYVSGHVQQLVMIMSTTPS